MPNNVALKKKFSPVCSCFRVNEDTFAVNRYIFWRSYSTKNTDFQDMGAGAFIAFYNRSESIKNKKVFTKLLTKIQRIQSTEYIFTSKVILQLTIASTIKSSPPASSTTTQYSLRTVRAAIVRIISHEIVGLALNS